MDIEILNNVKTQFRELIDRYNRTLRIQNHADISEETIRTWLNEFLGIFGWDVQNTDHVLQERMLRGTQYRRLREINSPHRKPDYVLLNGTNIKSFLDAKSLDVNIFTDAEVAYQIRSYGWSAQSPCAFVSNFEQLVIYDTRFIPHQGQPANLGVKQFSIDEYISNFEIIFNHFWHDNICSNKLEELYMTTAIEGHNRVDSQFMETLSSFRRKLASNLYETNPEIILNDTDLNYYTQVILDRIVFIRVCESKGIEEQEKLKNFILSEAGFWDSFKQSCYMEFYEHYDGAMFFQDNNFQRLTVNNDIIKDFINNLYYPFPYRFDVIPVKVIANIYEEFLGKQLVIDSGCVKEITKEEYVRSNGAVATPEHMVEMVCKQTLCLNEVYNIDELFKIKILDPCCGSGVFVISCYEYLTEKMLQLLQHSEQERQIYHEYYCVCNEQMLLTMAGRRAIITNCLFAIDSDESAIEVTKMSLALKMVDGNNPVAWEDIGAFGDKILKEIANNVKLGNTLVDVDGRFSAIEIGSIKPMNIKRIFADVFENCEGFSYIIGNPPYVETKYYKGAHPSMHTYLSSKYSSFEGKADLSVLFIERCLKLLSSTGKLGFIIQRRWFKTDYGSATRNLITAGKRLYKLIDFKATNIFKGRIVYISILILGNKPQDDFKYYYMPSNPPTIKALFENSDSEGYFLGCNFSEIPCQEGSAPWSFDYYNVSHIFMKLKEKWGALSDFPHLLIKDGIQALWKKIYHIKDVHFVNGIATGKNGFGETAQVEQDSIRAVIYNRVFYPFKNVEPDAYCIFPYEGASSNAIPFSEFEIRYPLAHRYLAQNEDRIKNTVQCRDGNLWHTFAREHNQNMYFTDKIIIPMTAKDTIATFIKDKGLYMDNANVWFISVTNANEDVMKAIACIINSTIFSVLGKSIANPQSGGYFKFNKQFLAPIPFPSSKITSGAPIVTQLATIYDEIFALQNEYLLATPANQDVFERALSDKWEELDSVCFELYEITENDKSQILSIGRTIDRVKLLSEAN